MAPTIGPTGFLLLTAGIGLPVRLARWRGAATPAEPLVLIVHIEYAWLGLALVLVVLADLLPASVGWLAALHALTAGAIDTMTQAIMTGPRSGTPSGRSLPTPRRDGSMGRCRRERFCGSCRPCWRSTTTSRYFWQGRSGVLPFPMPCDTDRC